MVKRGRKRTAKEEKSQRRGNKEVEKRREEIKQIGGREGLSSGKKGSTGEELEIHGSWKDW